MKIITTLIILCSAVALNGCVSTPNNDQNSSKAHMSTSAATATALLARAQHQRDEGKTAEALSDYQNAALSESSAIKAAALMGQIAIQSKSKKKGNLKELRKQLQALAKSDPIANELAFSEKSQLVTQQRLNKIYRTLRKQKKRVNEQTAELAKKDAELLVKEDELKQKENALNKLKKLMIGG